MCSTIACLHDRSRLVLHQLLALRCAVLALSAADAPAAGVESDLQPQEEGQVLQEQGQLVQGGQQGCMRERRRGRVPKTKHTWLKQAYRQPSSSVCVIV